MDTRFNKSILVTQQANSKFRLILTKIKRKFVNSFMVSRFQKFCLHKKSNTMIKIQIKNSKKIENPLKHKYHMTNEQE